LNLFRLVNKQVLTPLDLRSRFGLTGGNVFHGEMSWIKCS
jgi:phytoene dehydrogenase-like protein